nr:hypothetical protein [Tanacetum cinerariifolium]
MIAYMEKIKDTQFREIVDFLSRSSIFYALTVSPDVCASFIEQFWKTATFKIMNNISQIPAKVAGKPIVIIEASIRGNCMPSGPDVEIDYSKFTDSLKQTSTDESDSKPSEYASCESDSSVKTSTSMPELVENASKDDPHRALKDKGIVDSGCSRHMTGNKAHLVDYQEFKGVSVAFGGSNGRITAVAEGEDSGTPTESQPTPSPTQPSTKDQPPLTESPSDHDSSQDPRVNLEGIGGSRRDQIKDTQFREIVDFLSRSSIFYALTVSPDVCASFIEQFWKTATFKIMNNISQIPAKVAGKPIVIIEASIRGGHTYDRAEGSLNLEALSALCTNLLNRVLALETKKKLSQRKFVSKQGRKNAKSGSTKDGIDKLDAELDEDIEYIDTEEDLNEGRQSTVDTARPDDDTARPDVSTASQELSTAGPITTPTASTIFDDEEMTLADTLIKLKNDKAKGVTFNDLKSTYRPARSILTLKPLLTIDPKDKGKGVLEEPESAKKMTKSDFDAAQIARDEEIAR